LNILLLINLTVLIYGYVADIPHIAKTNNIIKLNNVYKYKTKGTCKYYKHTNKRIWYTQCGGKLVTYLDISTFTLVGVRGREDDICHYYRKISDIEQYYTICTKDIKWH